MRNILLFIVILFLLSCSKPKTVLICGDHVCVNKKEAQQFFEKNLTLEVKIIDKKRKKEIDLVELNLKDSSEDDRKIIISQKDKTSRQIKILSKKEVKKIKSQIKIKEKEKILVQKVYKNQRKDRKIYSLNKNKNISNQNNKKIQNTVNNRNIEVFDVCTILKKCSIEQISKYLLNKGKKKKFPNLALKEF